MHVSYFVGILESLNVRVGAHTHKPNRSSSSSCSLDGLVAAGKLIGMRVDFGHRVAGYKSIASIYCL